MTSRRDSVLGLLIVAACLVALAFVVADAEMHFVALAVPPVSERLAQLPGEPSVHELAVEAPVLDPALVRRAMAGGNGPAIGSVDAAELVTPDRLQLHGWICAPGPALAQRVYAIVDGKRGFDITYGYGVIRPDVGQNLDNDEFDRCGLEATFIVRGLAPGPHRLSLLAASADRRTLDPLSHDAAIVRASNRQGLR
jgi:hypothetical protein